MSYISKYLLQFNHYIIYYYTAHFFHFNFSMQPKQKKRPYLSYLFHKQIFLFFQPYDIKHYPERKYLLLHSIDDHKQSKPPP